MKVPDATFTMIRDRLWQIADERNWPTLGDQQKSVLYEEWIRDGQIGGLLSRYVAPGNVRVYIKDTIMKPYGRERIKDFLPILRLLNLPGDSDVVKEYIKPHGRKLAGGRIVSWGFSRDWKAVLFSVFERAYDSPTGIPFAAVIMYPTGKCQQPAYRRMIHTAAEKLGIRNLLWHEE